MFVDGKTHCFGCVFQCVETITQEDGTDFPEQIGCYTGRLEQFEDNGVVLEEAYNEEQNYYVIPDKVCAMYRTKGWAANQKTNSMKEWEELAEKEAMGRLVDVVVLVDNYDTNGQINSILTILDNQSWGHPAKVHLMLFDEGDCVPSNYIRLLSKYNFKWKFHHIIDTSMSDGDMVNRVGDKCDSLFYAVFRTDFPLRTDFVEKLFDRAYRKLKGFSVAWSEDIYSGLVIQSKAHRVVQGNGYEKSAETKLKELAEEQKLPHMIIKYGDLYAD